MASSTTTQQSASTPAASSNDFGNAILWVLGAAAVGTAVGMVAAFSASRPKPVRRREPSWDEAECDMVAGLRRQHGPDNVLHRPRIERTNGSVVIPDAVVVAGGVQRVVDRKAVNELRPVHVDQVAEYAALLDVDGEVRISRHTKVTRSVRSYAKAVGVQIRRSR